jgi:drug/metabolite transporter (DMT)-like permease
MTRRGWLLFAAMSLIWGLPYLLIKIAVDHVAPAVIVFGRTSIAAVVLIALAARAGALRPALQHWRPIVAFAAIEMAGPWMLLTNDEKRLPSGLTGLLVACVPLAGALAAYSLGDHSALRPIRLLGIAVGLGGVALLVGRDLRGAHGIPWPSVAMVMLVCVGYATAPFIVSHRLGGVPSRGVVAIALGATAMATAPIAWMSRPSGVPAASALWAILGLAIVCTGLAFIVFFALIDEVGPTRATLITFVNPAVAVTLGAVFLSERIQASTIAGFALVVAGCGLATRPNPTPAEVPVAP